jgi:hypothetical protein
MDTDPDRQALDAEPPKMMPIRLDPKTQLFLYLHFCAWILVLTQAFS